MGINLGAAMSPLLCGYVGETYGWHYGFGLATIGMLTGVAVFVAPIRLTQMLILAARSRTGDLAAASSRTIPTAWRSTSSSALSLVVGAASWRSSRWVAAGCRTEAGRRPSRRQRARADLAGVSSASLVALPVVHADRAAQR